MSSRWAVSQLHIPSGTPENIRAAETMTVTPGSGTPPPGSNMLIPAKAPADGKPEERGLELVAGVYDGGSAIDGARTPGSLSSSNGNAAGSFMTAFSTQLSWGRNLGSSVGSAPAPARESETPPRSEPWRYPSGGSPVSVAGTEYLECMSEVEDILSEVGSDLADDDGSGTMFTRLGSWRRGGTGAVDADDGLSGAVDWRGHWREELRRRKAVEEVALQLRGQRDELLAHLYSNGLDAPEGMAGAALSPPPAGARMPPLPRAPGPGTARLPGGRGAGPARGAGPEGLRHVEGFLVRRGAGSAAGMGGGLVEVEGRVAVARLVAEIFARAVVLEEAQAVYGAKLEALRERARRMEALGLDIARRRQLAKERNLAERRRRHVLASAGAAVAAVAAGAALAVGAARLAGGQASGWLPPLLGGAEAAAPITKE
mmetsp:Transcript_60041/g.190730  ORF Transcript_60041/g.190730 Transcript_60041/m.190730 type:complete len:429 (+) Transcript_60041:161-1447(+)